MVCASHMETLMGLDALTGITEHASVQTKFVLSHMQFESPEHELCVVYDKEQC
jgi:hypothetical protein